MTGPTLLEELTTAARLVRVEPDGPLAPVTLIVQPLSGASHDAHAALNLAAGPSAALAWHSRSKLGHEQVGAVVLQPGADLAQALYMSGLGQEQAQACAAVLNAFVTWSEEPD